MVNAVTGRGAREGILIAQYLTSYGRDIYNKKALPELLKTLVRAQDVDWIRMHYAYPTGFPLEVIDLMAAEPKICKYLDKSFCTYARRYLLDIIPVFEIGMYENFRTST